VTGRLGLAAALSSALLLAGCAVGGRDQPVTHGPIPCTKGIPSPITTPELIRTFVAHGIAMRPFHIDICLDAHTVAQISNANLNVSPARQRAAVLLHGSIMCELYDSSRTVTVQRLTFAHGRTAAVFMIENITCTVYPSFQIYAPSPDRHRDQDRAVERVMRSLEY
jgi:hypothetical protein